MKTLKILLLLVVILIAAGALGSKYYGKGEASKQEYKMAVVNKGNIQAIVSSTGRLSPLNTVKVGSQVSGNIRAIYVDFNSVVKKDQVIALIDPSIYAAQVEQAKAQLLKARMQLQERRKDIIAAEAGIESAEAQLTSAQATFREAESRYNRLTSLRNNKIVARSDLDSALAKRENAKGAVEVAVAKVRSAEAQIKRIVAQEKGVRALIAERKAALSLTEIKLKYCTIKSPIGGVVISRHVDVGQTVAATLQSPVLLTIAEDLTRMQVEVDVSEADVGQIKQGQDVEFNVDAFQDRKFKAKVRQVRNFATNIQNVVTYKIIADVGNNELLLRPGMTANVTIITAKVKDVLKIPNGTLRFKPREEVKETGPKKPKAIKNRSMYKKAVKRLNMDSEQAKTFEEIIKKADAKLKAVYALPEDSRDLRQAMRNYIGTIFKKLYGILQPDQYTEFSKIIKEMKEANKKRSRNRGRPAKVYILDGDGRPKALNIVAGITNETETQVIQGDLKEKDKVIMGLAFRSTGARKSSRSIFSTILGRR